MAKFGLIMKLQCHITPEDYVRGQFLHVRPRPAIKWAGLVIVVAALAICIQELAFPPSTTYSPRGGLRKSSSPNFSQFFRNILGSQLG